MNSLHNLPIRRKLTFVMMLTCSVVLVLTSAALFVFQTINTRTQYIRDLSILGGIIAHNSAAAVAFNDPEASAQTLSGLAGRSDVEAACLVLLTGQHVTKFDLMHSHHETDEIGLLDGYRLFGDDVLVASPVVLDGARLGTLYLRADFKPTRASLMRLYGSTLGCVLAASLLLALVLARWSQKLFTTPILHLADVVQSVTQNADYALRAVPASGDEVGVLTEAFNGMLGQIQQRDIALQSARDDLEKRVEERTAELRSMHQQLLDTSRKAGMAEVATSVLHNVGNVLNSVNVSCSVISQNVRNSRISSVARAADLLRENTEDLAGFLTTDPTGRKLPEFMVKLAGRLREEQHTVLDELHSLDRNIEHIKEIVSMQQNYAVSNGGVREVLPVNSLVEEALRLTGSALPTPTLQIVRHFEKVPPLSLEKHKILQILVNLVRNARHSLNESGRQDQRISLTIDAPDEQHVNVSVTDNGIGIPQENLTRIFAHGFTTKKDGHGFGLHSGVLAAQEMGGDLKVQSDGPGTGATFTLQIPLRTGDHN